MRACFLSLQQYPLLLSEEAKNYLRSRWFSNKMYLSCIKTVILDHWNCPGVNRRVYIGGFILEWPKKLKKVELDCPKVLCPLWIAPSCPELFNYSLDLKKVEGFKALKALTWKKLKTKFLPWIDLTRKLEYLQGLELKKPEVQGNSNR